MSNLNACLDIGEQREILCNMGKGLEPASDFFAAFDDYDQGIGTRPNRGSWHSSISNDHDHVFGPKVRLAANASNDHQGAATFALQLFTGGMPCHSYGTEHGLASGAEMDRRNYLNHWGSHDCLLREALFGPEHPRAAGRAGTQEQVESDAAGQAAGRSIRGGGGQPCGDRSRQIAAARQGPLAVGEATANTVHGHRASALPLIPQDRQK